MADSEWLNAFDRRFQAQPQACVGGQVANGLHENLYSVASQLVSEHVREFFTAKNSSLLFFPTNNIAFPAAALRQIGGFFKQYRLVASEDREICYRWITAGGSLAWEPRAQVIHAQRAHAAPVLDAALYLWPRRVSLLSDKDGVGRFLAPAAAAILSRSVGKTGTAILRLPCIASCRAPGTVPNGDSGRIPARTNFLRAADK
jgi:hypothetical protein